jgi:WD40 repeat protein
MLDLAPENEMRSLLTLCLLPLLPMTAVAQGKKPVEPIKVVELKRTEPVSYDKDIEPIFYKHCIACHSGSEKRGKLDLGSYDALIKGGKRGPAVVPGKSASSLLVKLAGRTMDPPMPPLKEEDSLSPEELALVKLWIDQGAKAPTGARVRPKIIVGLPPANVHPVRAVAVSPDKAAVAAGRGNQIHVYDAGSGKYIRSLHAPDLKTADGKEVQAAHLSLVESLAYSPDGKFLASGTFQEVNVWDAQTGMLRHKLTGFAHNVVALAFSGDGKLLATGGGAPTEDGEVKIFETGTWEQITDIKGGHSDTVYGVAFSPDGTKIASCGADKFIKVFEVPGGKFLKSFEGHTHHVLDVGWKGDGKLLASAGADNTIKIWDYEKGEQVRTINNAHTKQVTRLVFVGKTPTFLTCSGDQQVRSWNADNGGNTGNYAGNTDFVYAVSASPDGQVVAAGGQEGVVRLYRGPGQPKQTLLPPDAEAPAQK